MKVLIENRQKYYRIDRRKIRKKAELILSALECPDGELSILIVDDEEMAGLNDQYLGRPEPTNVIAFPMLEGRFREISPALLGDVVISIETATQEAVTARIPLEVRFDQLLIHGILHLFGYHHEKTSSSALTMKGKEKQLLKMLSAALK